MIYTINGVAMHLDRDKQEEIIYALRIAFADFIFFDVLAVPLLQRIFENPCKAFQVKSVLEDLDVDRDYFDETYGKKDMDSLRTVIVCGYVMIFNLADQSLSCKWSQQKFLEYYPELSKFDKEDPYLLSFHSFLLLAMKLIPAKRNKGLLIQVASRLEGSKEIYVLGSGQKDAVSRREAIYYRESGVIRKKKIPRAREEEDSDDSSIVKHSRQGDSGLQWEDITVSIQSESMLLNEQHDGFTERVGHIHF